MEKAKKTTAILAFVSAMVVIAWYVITLIFQKKLLWFAYDYKSEYFVFLSGGGEWFVVLTLVITTVWVFRSVMTKSPSAKTICLVTIIIRCAVYFPQRVLSLAYSRWVDGRIDHMARPGDFLMTGTYVSNLRSMFSPLFTLNLVSLCILFGLLVAEADKKQQGLGC